MPSFEDRISPFSWLITRRQRPPTWSAAARYTLGVAVISQLSERIKKAAADAGFELCGIAPVREFSELEHFSAWVEAGYAGEMKYLEARDKDGALKRASLRSAVPWARSVIVCAINYNTAKPYSTEVKDNGYGWISRYAWAKEDYHESVLRRLRLVEQQLTQAAGDARTWCYVDTGPLVERVYAKYAGVGWIGKNTCIINQKIGSWVFLGVILCSLELTPDLPAPDRCGTCTRCIDACPTDALIAPYQLDSNRCIAYLTIEKRGAIAEELRVGMGQHVYGCDICQDVCPWNRKAPATSSPELQPREELFNPALEWLAQMSTEKFREVFRHSPVKRTKLTGLKRNAAIAMGNSGDRRFIPVIKALTSHDDSAVAEAACWALGRLETKNAEDDEDTEICSAVPLRTQHPRRS